ncbi:MAG: hypothetical protein H7317_03375 [Pseudorhodobacter sp.]|nr:hypothetical protein [Pseudorhodobacter sp.]
MVRADVAGRRFDCDRPDRLGNGRVWLDPNAAEAEWAALMAELDGVPVTDLVVVDRG